MPTGELRTYTAKQLIDLSDEISALRAYLNDLTKVEEAEAEKAADKRATMQRAVLSLNTRYLSADATQTEISLLFRMNAEAIRQNIAHRVTHLQARWNIRIDGLPNISEATQ